MMHGNNLTVFAGTNRIKAGFLLFLSEWQEVTIVQQEPHNSRQQQAGAKTKYKKMNACA
jgi:hypothetical protein